MNALTPDDINEILTRYQEEREGAAAASKAYAEHARKVEAYRLSRCTD